MVRLGVALIALKYILEGALLIALSFCILFGLFGQVSLQPPMALTLPGLEFLPVFLVLLLGVASCLIGVWLWEGSPLAFYTVFILELLDIFLVEEVEGKMISLLILVYLLTVRDEFKG